jgi:hypothetical protein
MTESNKTLLRKVTDKNKNTGNVTLNPEHMAAYYNGDIDKITVVAEDGSTLESYYGAGLRKLIESAKAHKSGRYLLARRHFAPKETTVEE